ncbi:MAG TPA: Zn-ribbon containing protein, partial [Candidatus Methanoperedens sp.]|nr:Zn-ribbon containing protein [Candidatus Methanoperedens sp.]
SVAKTHISTNTVQISPEASNFIREIDELLGIKDEKPELKNEPETETKEVGNRIESIRILSPGQYELNLESLLERKEIVMALKEDGTYIVNLPSVFKKKKGH